MATATLSPAACRSANVGKQHRAYCETQQRFVAPDPHSAHRLEAMRQRGETQKTLMDLLQLLANRSVVFLGDSVTEQLTNALECSLHAAQLPALRFGSVSRKAPELLEACRQAVQSSSCSPGCRAADSALHVWSICRELGTTAQHLALSKGVVKIRSIYIPPPLNVSIYPRFGSIARLRQPCASPCIGGKHCHKTLTACEQLPTNVALATAVLDPDVIVMNFGLHYNKRRDYEVDLAEGVTSMNSFGARKGKVAIIRETSSQHFPSPTGDFAEAIARDPSLVVTSDKGGSVWQGPSMCFSKENGARGWRNALLYKYVANVRYVRIQAFENLTEQMW
eukprot:CAMPEP_0119326390 /NCGR_PEP_ID=MMETSP1333-20130426/68244_1 /TAXON_ID=418940 /ORGANISM="Scyphosphaera apsteinii, Strain RCC1455" /LENGTH=335 /DNA_ID=CAMNT_0007334685 /DNA_START=124 /DNA_END=1128 /DNA_ORIENTATION=+